MQDFRNIEKEVRGICEAREAGGIFVLTDSNVAPLVEGLLSDCPRLVVEAGEESKSVAGLERVWEFLMLRGALRRSVLVNIGGGMVSDLGGFAAATFKRGIGCINLPTTLLAAVDAAIGGKTGINFGGLKNEVGAFSLPLAVIPLTGLFGSLPDEEWLSGAGEALKTGLLDSEELFGLAASKAFLVDRDPEVVAEVVRRCQAFKNAVVAEDFREGGRRRILNLGHTAGHAIEAWKIARGTPMAHGIAVAHGLRIALRLSVEKAGLDPEVLRRYEAVLESFFPPLEMSEKDWEEASHYMAHDKKNTRQGEPSWVLLKGIGRI